MLEYWTSYLFSKPKMVTSKAFVILNDINSSYTLLYSTTDHILHFSIAILNHIQTLHHQLWILYRLALSKQFPRLIFQSRTKESRHSQQIDQNYSNLLWLHKGMLAFWAQRFWTNIKLAASLHVFPHSTFVNTKVLFDINLPGQQYLECDTVVNNAKKKEIIQILIDFEFIIATWSKIIDW